MLKKILLAMIAIATVFTLASCSGDTPVPDGGSSKTLNVPEALWGDWTLMTEADEEAGLEASPMGAIRISKTTVDVYLDPAFSWDNIDSATKTYDIADLFSKGDGYERSSLDIKAYTIYVTRDGKSQYSFSYGNTPSFKIGNFNPTTNKIDIDSYDIIKR